MRNNENRQAVVVAIDLLPLRPGGENGGIKPAIFTLLKAVGDEAGDSLLFVYLTNSASHTQVRGLARTNDLLVCVLEDSNSPAANLAGERSNEFTIISAPSDLVRRIEADALYCPFGATTFHVSDVPTIALIADLLHKDYPLTLTQEQISEREAYIQKTIRVASKIQCISRSGMDQMIKHYQLEPGKLFFTYLPVHVRSNESSIGTDCSPRQFAGRPFFFYPANFWLHKNHEVLLLSFLQYRARAGRNAWELVLTFHEDPRAEYLRSLAENLGIAEFVHFMGFVTEEKLRELWQQAGGLAFPSLHEGFGIPLVEAMHYGVPIICGDDFSLREVAGDACYVVDPRKPVSLADALIKVSSDRRLRDRLVKCGHERLQLFDLRTAARQLLNQFESFARTDEDFARKPSFVCQPLVLTAASPASSERWTIELISDFCTATSRFTVYLDDWPFGTFSSAAGSTETYSFSCRPQGRLLGVRQEINNDDEGLNAARSPIRRIVATNGRDQHILLYARPEHMVHDED